MLRPTAALNSSYLAFSRPLLIWTLILLWCLFPLFWEIPAWATGLTLGMVAARWGRELVYFKAGPPGRLREILFKILKGCLVILTTALTWQEYHTLFNYLAAITLFALYAPIKFLETTTRRDEQILIYFLFFLVVSNTIFYQDLYISLHVLVSLTLLFERLMYLYAPPRWPWKRRMRILGRSFLICLPVILLVFFLFPRTMGTRWGVPGTRELRQAVVGFKETLNPASYDELKENTSLAMRVEFKNGHQPSMANLYWRGMELGDTDGMNWRMSFMFLPPQKDSDWQKNVGVDLEEGALPYHYEILLEPYGGRTILALDFPLQVQKISGNITQINRRQGDVWQVMFPIGSRIKYTGISYDHPALAWRPQAASSSLWPASGPATASFASFAAAYDAQTPKLSRYDQQRYLATPYHPSGEILTWLNSMNHASPEAFVQDVLAYFVRHLTYAFPEGDERPKVNARNYFATMIFQYRRGICSDFASLFALAMRWAKIPARVITGYQGGEYNPYGQYWQVLQNHAHAWTEVFLPGKGWVRIDPTAYILPARITQGSLVLEKSKALQRNWWQQAWDQVTLFFDDINYRWANFLISFDREGQKEWFWQHGQRFYRPFLAFMISILAIGLFILLLVFIQKWQQRPRIHLTPWQKIYQKLERWLARHRLVRAAYWGPHHFVQYLQTQRPDIDWPSVILPYALAEYAQQDIDYHLWQQKIKQMKKILRRPKQ